MRSRPEDARIRLVALVLLVLAGAAGCGPDGDAPDELPVRDSVYVEVMARLALVDSALGPPAYLRELGIPSDSARALVLAEWNVQGEELVEFARTRGSEPGAMKDIWERVRERSDSLEAAGWRPGGGPVDSPVAPDSAAADSAEVADSAGETAPPEATADSAAGTVPPGTVADSAGSARRRGP